MMNPDVKKMWVDALRSGRYKQGTGALRKGNTFCCLGVLCDVYSQEVPGSPKWDPPMMHDEVEQQMYSYDGRPTTLPKSVMGWAGLAETNPTLSFRSLAERNDNGAIFDDIADVIESQL